MKERQPCPNQPEGALHIFVHLILKDRLQGKIQCTKQTGKRGCLQPAFSFELKLTFILLEPFPMLLNVLEGEKLGTVIPSQLGYVSLLEVVLKT